MIISFRIRLFLIATTIVGIVLAAVMATGWSRVLSFEVGRLDERLCMEAKRLAMDQFTVDELPRLEKDIMNKLRLKAREQLMLRIEASPNDRSYQSEFWNDAAAPLRPQGSVGPDCVLDSFAYQGSQWRAARALLPAASSVVAADLIAPEAEIKGALKSALMIEIPLALVLAALGAWLLASMTMRPVNRLRDAMKSVTPLALDKRLPAAGEDREFVELIAAYNTMLERLERSFQQASRFSADAAHELKTPLTILRGRIEQALRKTESADMQRELSELLDEVGLLSAITRKLLLLAHADAGKLDLSLAPVDLTEMLFGMSADAQMMLEEQKLTFSVEKNLHIVGDAVLVRQLLNNLISNAVRYCTPDGAIELQARRNGNIVEVRVSNSSRVISAAERARFFERFYRGDSAHNRRVEGNGLGLSLAFEIALAHGGSLQLQASADTMVSMLLTLPLE